MFVYSQSSSVIQLFSISFILPSSIYIKLIPYSVQFQNHFFSIILPNHQHHVSSNRFTPRKKFPYLLIIHNISKIQRFISRISSSNLSSYNFHTIPIFSLGPSKRGKYSHSKEIRLTRTYSKTLSAASLILTIRKDRLQSLTSSSILCQDGFLSCGRAIR